MRLHLGCGDKLWPGWINCDAYGDPDVVTDCRKLPYPDNSVEEIQSIHFLEHVPRLEVENMLMDWHRALKPHGKLTIEVPCLDKMAKLIVEGERNMRLTLLGIFGDPRDPKPGMMHAWAYTVRELIDVVRQCGFDNVEELPPQFHVPARDMRVVGYKFGRPQ